MPKPVFGDLGSIYAAKYVPFDRSLWAFGVEGFAKAEKERVALFASKKDADEALMRAMEAARSPQPVVEVRRVKRVKRARINTIAPSDYTGDFRVIYSAIDTYSANVVGAEVRDDFMTLLEVAQEDAKEAEGDVLGPLPPFVGASLAIRPHGGGTFRYLLGNDDITAKVRKRGHAANLAAVQVRLSAACLHRLGYVAAMAALADWVELWCPGARLQPSEVHLCADTQGWVPTLADFQARAFVCPVGRPHLIPYGDYLGYARWGTGGAAGSRSGPAPMQLAIYDKTEDIRVHDKGWMIPLWAQNPAYKADEMVVRIELRLTREWLHERGIDAQENVVRSLPAIWHEGLEWCRYAVPSEDGGDSNRSRLKTRDEWRVLLAIVWDGGRESVLRRIDQARPKLERTLAALGGYLTTLNALFAHSLPFDLPGILELAGPALAARYEARGEDWGGRVESRCLRLGGVAMI